MKILCAKSDSEMHMNRLCLKNPVLSFPNCLSSQALHKMHVFVATKEVCKLHASILCKNVHFAWPFLQILLGLHIHLHNCMWKLLLFIV